MTKFDTLIAEIRALREATDRARALDAPMTRDEAAAYLKVHPSTLYRWAVEENRIAYSRLTDCDRGALRFRREDLDDFVKTGIVEAV